MRRNPAFGSGAKAALAALALIAGAAAVPGCTDDDATSNSMLVTGPATLAVTEPGDGACVVLRNDAAWTARVSVQAANWYLRPRDFCGDYPQCGWIAAFVDDQRVAESAATVVDVPFRGLSSPSGQHVIRIELRTDADQVATGADGKPLSVELTVTAVEPGGYCPGTEPDAGSDVEQEASDDAAPEASDDVAADVVEDSAAEDGGADAAVDAEPDSADDAAPEASSDDVASDGASDADDGAASDGTVEEDSPGE